MATRFLTAELITGKAEDVQSVDVVVKRTQTCVLRGGPSTTGDIDDEGVLPRKLVERHGVALKRLHGEIVKGHARTLTTARACPRGSTKQTLRLSALTPNSQ